MTEEKVSEPAPIRQQAEAWLQRLACPRFGPEDQVNLMAWVLESGRHEAALRELCGVVPEPDGDPGDMSRDRTGPIPEPGQCGELSEEERAVARRWAEWLAEEGPSPAYFDGLRVWLRRDRRRRAAYSAALEALMQREDRD